VTAELDVQVQHVRRRVPYRHDSFLDGTRLGSDSEVVQLGDESDELRAGRRLVIDYHNGVAHVDTGKARETTAPCGSREPNASS